MSRDAFRKYISDQAHTLPPPAGQGKVISVKFAGPPPPPGSFLPPPPPLEAPNADRLPDYKSAADIVREKIVLPEVMIESLLHRGCKVLLAGGSKSFKSWVLIDLALSVATGAPFWSLNTKPGRVLYLNFELIDGFFEERILAVCRARDLAPPASLMIWHLRGHCYDLNVLAKVIYERIQAEKPFDLIVVDPIYKALGELDENKASDMTQLMNLLESISVRTGASIAFGSHFSKGNQAAKEAKDRPSGSGVLIRDPDVILTMTRHEEEACYTVNSELRYLPSLAPFVLRWGFPLMKVAEELNPDKLYRPDGKSSSDPDAGTTTYTEEQLASCIPVGGAVEGLWRKMVALRFGKVGPEFHAMKGSLISKGVVRRDGAKFVLTSITLRS